MARAPSYPRSVIAGTSKVKDKKVKEADLTDDDKKVIDGYAEKLLKYVPVEATVFFALAYGKLQDHIDGVESSGRAWWALIFGIGALIAVVFAGAGKRNREPLPWYFFVLTVVAFVAWTVGTTTIAQEMFPEFLAEANDVVFAGAALLIPGVDQLLTRHKQHGGGDSATPAKTDPVKGGSAVVS